MRKEFVFVFEEELFEGLGIQDRETPAVWLGYYCVDIFEQYGFGVWHVFGGDRNGGGWGGIVLHEYFVYGYFHDWIVYESFG